MNFHVIVERLAPREILRALPAFVGSLSSVDFDMLLQPIRCAVGAVALIAFVGSFSSVDSEMLLQSIRSAEGAIAVFAFVPLEFGVRLLMTHQMRVEGEPLVTCLALKGPHSSMNLFVRVESA